MTAPSSPPAALLQAIEKIVTEHWAAEGQGILLARIGQSLTQQGYALHDELGGRKLGEVVRDLDATVEVFRDSDSPTSLRARPRHVAANEPIADYQAVEVAKPRAPRFLKTVWLAFTRPLPPGFNRWLISHPTVRYRDLAVGAAKPEQAHEIQSRYVIDGSSLPGGIKDEQVVVNIEAWARENGVPTSELQPGEGAQKKSRAPNLLSDLIASLDGEDLKRISLPLDIVARLLKS